LAAKPYADSSGASVDILALGYCLTLPGYVMPHMPQ